MATDEYPDGLSGEIARCYRDARDHWNAWREEARECYRFYAGDQWTQDELDALERRNRPAITFNRIGPLVDAVLGHEANNRAEVRFIPRTLGDAAVSEMLTNASAYFRDQCDAEHEESDAFRDAIITGLGCTQICLSDERNPEYDLKEERIDPLEMLPDPNARKPNLADARWFVREKRMSKDEILSIWPDAVVGSDPSWTHSGSAVNPSSSPRNSYRDGGEEQEIKGHLVIEYQWRDTEIYYVLTRPDTGEQITIDEDQYDAAKEQIEATGAEVEMKRRYIWRRAFMVGNDIVQEDTPSPEHCTYTFITGKRDRAKGTWFGIVRALLGPQRMLNKWLSQMTHIVNSNSQGGVMVEKDAITDIDDFEAKWADPAGIVEFQPGALGNGKVQPKPPPTYPAGVDRLYALGEQAFMQVSGVNAELLGLADREQPGVLEWQRKQSAVSMLAPLFDSLRRFRKMMGRTWLFFMTTYVSDGRMIRITSDDGQEGYVQLYRDPTVSKYDIIVDQSSSAPNLKEQTWSVLIQLFPAIKGMLDPQTMLLLLEYSPLPETLLAKLKKMAAEKAQQGPPPDPKMLEAQASIQADQAKMQAQIQMQQQKLQADLQLQQQKAAADIQAKREELQAKMQLAIAEAQAGYMLENQKAIMQHQAAVHSAEIKAGGIAQAAAVTAEADQRRNAMLEHAATKQTELVHMAQQDRDAQLQQFLADLQARNDAKIDQLGQFLGNIANAQQAQAETLAGAIQGLTDAQMAETQLVKDPATGAKRVVKVPRKKEAK